MTSEPATLGTRIRRARERARLSQVELAKAVGASVRAVGDWENDRRKPRNRLGAIEQVLDVDLSEQPQPQPDIPQKLLDEIMTNKGLTQGEREAVIRAVREAIARERGEAGPSSPGRDADRETGRQASLPARHGIPFRCR